MLQPPTIRVVFIVFVIHLIPLLLLLLISRGNVISPTYTRDDIRVRIERLRRFRRERSAGRRFCFVSFRFVSRARASVIIRSKEKHTQRERERERERKVTTRNDFTWTLRVFQPLKQLVSAQFSFQSSPGRPGERQRVFVVR